MSGIPSIMLNKLKSIFSVLGHSHGNEQITPLSVELWPRQGEQHGGYIDFHYNGTQADYTSRIIEDTSGIVRVIGALYENGTRVSTNGHTHTNGEDISCDGYTLRQQLTSCWNGINSKASLSDVKAMFPSFLPTSVRLGCANGEHHHTHYISSIYEESTSRLNGIVSYQGSVGVLIPDFLQGATLTFKLISTVGQNENWNIVVHHNLAFAGSQDAYARCYGTCTPVTNYTYTSGGGYYWSTGSFVIMPWHRAVGFFIWEDGTVENVHYWFELRATRGNATYTFKTCATGEIARGRDSASEAIIDEGISSFWALE